MAIVIVIQGIREHSMSCYVAYFSHVFSYMVPTYASTLTLTTYNLTFIEIYRKFDGMKFCSNIMFSTILFMSIGPRLIVCVCIYYNVYTCRYIIYIYYPFIHPWIVITRGINVACPTWILLMNDTDRGSMHYIFSKTISSKLMVVIARRIILSC